MKESELRKQIRAKIEAGSSPQQVYDEFHKGANAPDEKLADLVRYVPTLERRADYKVGQWVLLGLLCAAIAWKVNAVASAMAEGRGPSVFFHGAFVIGYIVALFAVAKYWRNAHSIAGLLAFLDIMRFHDQPGSSDGTSLVVILLFGVLAVLGMYLQRKLTPDYITLKERYTNAEGQERLREVIRFGD